MTALNLSDYNGDDLAAWQLGLIGVAAFVLVVTVGCICGALWGRWRG